MAVQTLMTLFFSGRKYASRCVIDGENIQDWLQRHFINAYRRLGEAIREAGDLLDECVIGWDSINEPNRGYVGLEDLSTLPESVRLRLGPMPTAFEGMKLGMGISTEVETWKFTSLGAKKDGKVTIDSKGAKAWLDAESDRRYADRYGWKRGAGWVVGECIWAQHGVWDTSTKQLLKPDYFSEQGGAIDFGRDFWRSHWLAWAKMVRSVHPRAVHFIHPPVFEVPPPLSADPECSAAMSDRAAFSAHFYDGLTLITKHWNWYNADALGLIRGKYSSLPFALRFGEKAVRKCMRDQLGYLRQDTFDSIGKFPTMMGEIGIPYDLDKGKGYKTGNYDAQSHAMDASMNACDGENLMSYTLWTYNPENTHRWGENWNGEDLSVWSLDDRKPSPLQALPSAEASTSSLPKYASPTSTLSPTSTSSLLQPSLTSLSRSAPPYAPAQDIDYDSGARAIESFVRPYPIATAGLPKSVDFDVKSSTFTFTLEARADDLRTGNESLPTEIFLPAVHYGAAAGSEAEDAKPLFEASTDALDLDVKVSRGRWETEGQVLKWHHGRPEAGSTEVWREKISVKRRRGTASASVWEGWCGKCLVC